MDSVLIFFLFLGPLVFFHELGHFLFARLAGVRVEVFSIGFGPKIFKFKKGDTQYAFSLIPLGGYVKMFGDDPLSEEKLSEEEKKVAFTHKSKWARFWIVFGGPLANFILAFFIYFSLLIVGERVPEVNFGHVVENSKYYQAGFRSGDVLKRVNDMEIVSFDDFNLLDSKITSVTVKRNSEDIKVDFTSSGADFIKEFSALRGQLRIPLVIDLQGQEWILSLSRDSFNPEASLEFLSSKSNITELYAFKVISDKKIKKIEDIKADLQSVKTIKLSDNFYTSLSKSNFYPVDLSVESIVMDSPADKAKLKKLDIVTAIDGKVISSFKELRDEIQKSKKDEARKVLVLRDGKKVEFDLVPQLKESGKTSIFAIGVYSSVRFLPTKMVDSASKGLFKSIEIALIRTNEAIVKTVIGFKKLITGEVSMKNIGGPLAIGEVASNSFYISISMFLRLMAIISVNLGIINLFPIPVLDGGHIVFLFLELINRGPLSRKKMQMAQQFGMSILFLLIFVALYNDITRLF